MSSNLQKLKFKTSRIIRVGSDAMNCICISIIITRTVLIAENVLHSDITIFNDEDDDKM